MSITLTHQTHNIRNMFDSYAYSFRFIDLEKIRIILVNDSCDSNHSSKCTVLVFAAFPKKKRRNKKTKTA